jgi:ornithine cyclodeaminase
MSAHKKTQTLVIGGSLVHDLMPPADCIEVIERTMRAVSRGGAALPLRIGAKAAAHPSWVVSMPGFLDEPASFGAKVIAVTRGQPAGMPSHQGVVVLFDIETGATLAILDANSITALRTAAATAVATRILAPAKVSRLAILGAGEQAETHIHAVTRVRAFERISLWSRSPDRARAFAARVGRSVPVPIEACDSAAAAVRDADVICTVTASSEPVLKGEWVRPGTHVNLVGASMADAREADDELVKMSSYFVDYRPSTMAQAGELAHAFGGQASHMAAHIRREIGEVLNGAPGRQGPDEITIYKSLGIAAQDLATAHAIYERARAKGLGTSVEL